MIYFLGTKTEIKTNEAKITEIQSTTENKTATHKINNSMIKINTHFPTIT